MARSEARLAVTIWTDGDFLALTPTAQRMFMFLLSQVDLAHDGVIALRERRWSKSAAGLTRADVERDLDELHAARFVVVDEDAEELLIRSFIRRDKVYRQPNVLRSAADHLPLVTSAAIRATLAEELSRIAALEGISEGSAAIVAEMLAALGNPSGKGSGNPSVDPSGRDSAGVPEGLSEEPGRIDERSEIVPPCGTKVETGKTPPAKAANNVSAGDKGSGNPSGNPSAGTPGERGVVTAVSRDSPNPVPLSPYPDPLSPPPAVKPRASARDTATGDTAFDEFWAAYPRREAKRTARKAWDKAITRATPTEIINGASRYRDRPGREHRYTAHPATWLNGDRWNDDLPQPGHDLAIPGQPQHPDSPSPQSTADKRFADAMALAAKFAAEEAS